MAFIHTHTRPDRDQHVRVNFDNAINHDEFKLCEGCCCEPNGIPYDCDSVMHYAKNQMGKAGLDTLEAVDPSKCKLLPYEEWNTKEPYISGNDIAMIKFHYDC